MATKTREQQLVEAAERAMLAIERYHATNWRTSTARQAAGERLSRSLKAWEAAKHAQESKA